MNKSRTLTKADLDKIIWYLNNADWNSWNKILNKYFNLQCNGFKNILEIRQIFSSAMQRHHKKEIQVASNLHWSHTHKWGKSLIEATASIRQNTVFWNFRKSQEQRKMPETKWSEQTSYVHDFIHLISRVTTNRFSARMHTSGVTPFPLLALVRVVGLWANVLYARPLTLSHWGWGLWRQSQSNGLG